MKKVISYRGKKVILRPVDPELDLPFMYKWINDSRVNQYLNAESPVSIGAEREYLESIGKDPKDCIYAIETIKKRKFIGMMGLHNIKPVDQRAITGAVIGDRCFWGKGYGADAKMLLLYHGFMKLNLRKINSSVLAFNRRSQMYLQKTGYQIEGVLKRQIYYRGEFIDKILLALFREDFEPLWGEYINDTPAKKLIY